MIYFPLSFDFYWIIRASIFQALSTIIYIFADSLILHHSDCPHSHALQYEATILQELDSIAPDDFRTELHDSLTSLY